MSGTGGAIAEAAQSLLQAAEGTRSKATVVFESIEPPEAVPRVVGVDGGSSIVLDARSMGLYCVRAGFSLRETKGRFLDAWTARQARVVTRRNLERAWNQVSQAYEWGAQASPFAPDGHRLVSQFAEYERGLAEFDAARQALVRLQPQDLLLLDGSLQEEDKFHPQRENLLERARDRGVAVVALSKDTSVSLEGVLPFTIELEELAAERAVAAPWMCDVTDVIGPVGRGWRTLGVRLDSRAPAFRLDVAAVDIARVVGQVVACCDDASYPGYPYVLARVHQRVHFESGESAELRNQLEDLVGRRRGHRFTSRLFGRGRDVLAFAD